MAALAPQKTARPARKNTAPTDAPPSGLRKVPVYEEGSPIPPDVRARLIEENRGKKFPRHARRPQAPPRKPRTVPGDRTAGLSGSALLYALFNIKPGDPPMYRFEQPGGRLVFVRPDILAERPELRERFGPDGHVLD